MQSFSAMSKLKQFSEDYYPYADQGIKIATIFFKNMSRSIIYIILYLIFKLAFIFMMPDEQKVQSVKKGLSQLSLDNLKINVNIGDTCLYFGSLACKYISYIFLIIALIFIAITTIAFILYIFNIIRRQRRYERNVLINDYKAYSLKKKILRSREAYKVLRDEKHAIRKKREGKDKRLSQKDKLPLEVQKEFMKMIVQVNSRESLDNKGYVDTQYRIRFNLPSNDEVADALNKKVEGINSLASRLSKARITFGAKFESDDQSSIVFRAWQQEPDKYIYEVEDDDAEQEVVEMESTYPLSMLNDQQEVIDSKKSDADQWAKRNIKTIKTFLTTSEIDCTFVKYEVGNAMASYTFMMADDVKLPHFDKLPDNLDNMIKKKGSDVSISEGELVLSIPLPDDVKLPLNVPTMYRDLFG